MPALVLLLATVLLVMIGALLYAVGWIGWAQAGWVFASGTAGAGVTVWIGDKNKDPDA